MAGHEDAVHGVALGILDRHEIAQRVEHLIASHGIKARRRLVQNEQARAVRQRAGKRELHAHTAGEVLDGFFGVEIRGAKALLKAGGIPG